MREREREESHTWSVRITVCVATSHSSTRPSLPHDTRFLPLSTMDVDNWMREWERREREGEKKRKEKEEREREKRREVEEREGKK